MFNKIKSTQHPILNTAQSGQILIIILLVMLVGLTVGLGVLGRSTQDVRIMSRVEESSQAFAAAEAGIEQALQGVISGTGGTGEITPGVSYDVEINQIGATSGLYPENPRAYNVGEVFTVWLVDHDASGSIIETPVYTNNRLNVCWTDNGTTPALAMTLVYKQGANYKMAHAGYDPISRGNGFEISNAAPGAICPDSDFRENLNFNNFGGISSGIDTTTDTLIALRIRPLYDSTQIVVLSPGGQLLPSQGIEIISSGTSQVTTRKIKVSQPFKTLPAFFDATLFSTGGGLTK